MIYVIIQLFLLFFGSRNVKEVIRIKIFEKMFLFGDDVIVEIE